MTTDNAESKYTLAAFSERYLNLFLAHLAKVVGDKSLNSYQIERFLPELSLTAKGFNGNLLEYFQDLIATNNLLEDDTNKEIRKYVLGFGFRSYAGQSVRLILSMLEDKKLKPMLQENNKVLRDDLRQLVKAAQDFLEEETEVKTNPSG